MPTKPLWAYVRKAHTEEAKKNPKFEAKEASMETFRTFVNLLGLAGSLFALGSGYDLIVRLWN